MTKIQILGTGCAKCQKLADNIEQAAASLKVERELEKITDINQIMAFGVMVTPALVIDGKVLLSGKVPTAHELEQYLR